MITCGKCKSKHESVEDVKRCYSGQGSRQQINPNSVPEFASDPATEKQLDYIKSLIDQHDTDKMPVGRESELFMDVLDGKQVSKREASSLIAALKACPAKLIDPWPAVPAGKYATESDSGHVVFWVVDKPTEGKWAGRVFVNQLVGGVGDWRTLRTPRVTSQEAMKRIEADPVAAASLFGYKAGICGRCMSPLSNVRSRAAGYGQHCAGKVGWPYPDKRDAKRILREMGVSEKEIAALEKSNDFDAIYDDGLVHG